MRCFWIFYVNILFIKSFIKTTTFLFIWYHSLISFWVLMEGAARLSLLEIVFSIRIGNEIIEQTTSATLEHQITENLQLHFNTALNSVLLND